MASHAITALLALTTGLLFPDNIFDYFSGGFNQNHLPVQAPAPIGIISATKTIKLAADTAAPRLDFDFQHGEGAVTHFPLVLLLFLSLVILSLLCFAYIHRLAQDAAASLLATIRRSALEAATAEISHLKKDLHMTQEQLKSRADQVKAYEDQIANLTKDLSESAMTVTCLNSAKDFQTLLCMQQEGMLKARDSTIDKLKARENELAIDMEKFHMLQEELQSRADETTGLRDHMMTLEESCERIMANVAALASPADDDADAVAASNDPTTTAATTELEIDEAEAAGRADPTDIVTGDGTPAADSTITTDNESESSHPRSSLSAESAVSIPFGVGGVANPTENDAEDGDEDDDGGSAGEDDAENGQPGTGEGKKKRRRKRGKRKSARTLIQPPPNAPKGPKAMGYY